jgi:hypothetical protein
LRRRTSDVGEKAREFYSLKSKKGNFPKESEMPGELKGDMTEK